MASVDDTIDMLLGGYGGAQWMKGIGNPGQGLPKPEIVRCCVGTDQPYMKLKNENINYFLPLPENISSGLTSTWQTETSDVDGAAGIARTTMLAAMKDSGLPPIGRTSRGFMKGVASGIVNKIYGGRLGSVKMKTAMLPVQELRYEGGSFRSFSFNWHLVPRSQKESNEIWKAIQKIQYGIAPEGSGGYMSYPDVWQISWGAGDAHLPRIGSAVCTNFTVNYGGRSDGSVPVHNQEHYDVFEYDLSMSFQETALLTKQLIKANVMG